VDLSARTRIRHHRPMTDAATDPIQSPDGYRNMLLGYLAGDDPATVQAATVARLRELVAEAGDGLRTRPEPKEWSVIECIGHLTDSEVVTSARVRWILAEDEPQIIGYDQDLWVDGLRHGSDDPEALIALFDALRSANLALLATRSAADLERFGRHNERGLESYGLMIRLTAGHDRFHVAQAERALAAVRGVRQAAVEPR
jgi:DinB family protein